MTAGAVTTERRGAVAWVTIDRPPVNALSSGLLGTLAAQLSAAGADPAVRAVVLTAAGTKAFVAGADIRELEALLRNPNGADAYLDASAQAFAAIAACRVPVVVAVHGDALGGGFELVLACDVSIVEPSARLGLPEVTLGLLPGGGGTQRVLAAVGPVKAKELLLLGRPLLAPQALAVGLVTEVCAPGHARDRAGEVAATLAAGSSAALATIKALVDRTSGVEAGLGLERDAFVRVLRDADAAEGCAAFLAKRPPIYGPRHEGTT